MLITMSNLPMVMSFKCSNCFQVIYDYLRLSFNALSLCIIGVKYQHTIGAVCAYARVFGNDRGVRLLEHVR